MSAMLATRSARRRVIAYALLVAVSLGLMAVSSTPAAKELQHGVAFAFRPFQSAIDSVASTVSSVFGALGEIQQLRAENESLRQDNARLQSENARLQAVRQENDQLTALLQLRSGLTYTTVAARIIARDSSEFRRVATIDRGTDQGLAVGDVVIGAGGSLVGRVVDAGPTYARVTLINDTSSTVIGQVADSSVTGEVVGQLGGVLIMRNVDATETVQLGQEVLTAGIELAGGVRSPYPRGLLIGQVVDVKRDANAVVQTAYLKSAADLDTLSYVLVVTDYQGGLPPPDQQPTDRLNPDGTLPQGEQPYVTPAASTHASAAPSPRASASPSPH
ncbi:MAG TPA: rod shape-determining protein MreC [Candidatus Dormibacteraeota bacterium]|nr:rod shape-determining protein MreC [Candidatus Dormibacteraeota bacterium]